MGVSTVLERLVSMDFSKKCGKIKPLNGVCSGPVFSFPFEMDLCAEYASLGVPLVRTFSSELPAGLDACVDIRRVFPDPMLDERFPESYDFSECDKRLSAIRSSGAAIYLSVYESRGDDGRGKYPRVDAGKWARIVERILLRYSRGWGGGPKLGVKTVEIWPGADLPAAFPGGALSYAEFYATVASHLKSVYPTLKVGAYSSGGFASLNRYGASDEERGYVKFLESFLGYISTREESVPLDFFSWRATVESAEELALHSNYAKNYLAQYGYRRALSVVSELKLDTGEGSARLSRSYPASLAALLISAADASIDMMLYSSAYPYSASNALFTVDDGCDAHRYAAFGVMEAYGVLLSHGTEVATGENFRREIYSLAAASDTGGALLVATGDYSGRISVEISGSPFRKYSIKGMLGGGRRGAGYSTEERDLPLGSGKFSMKVGAAEIYLITLTH